jgi:hypothetical protein
MKTLDQLKLLSNDNKREIIREAAESIIPWVEQQILFRLKHNMHHFLDGRFEVDLPIKETYKETERELIRINVLANMSEAGWEVMATEKESRIVIWWHKDDS